jgi:hypothetical protein
MSDPPDAPVIVHLVGISKYGGGQRPPVYAARCTLCGEVLELKEGPLLLMKSPGLYAVIGDIGFPKNMKVWSVTEPLPDGMRMCR